MTVRSVVRRKVLHFCVADISNSSFVQFAIWDTPGQIDFFEQNFDPEMIFGGCGALIYVIDAQVSERGTGE